MENSDVYSYLGAFAVIAAVMALLLLPALMLRLRLLACIGFGFAGKAEFYRELIGYRARGNCGAGEPRLVNGRICYSVSGRKNGVVHDGKGTYYNADGSLWRRPPPPNYAGGR